MSMLIATVCADQRGVAGRLTVRAVGATAADGVAAGPHARRQLASEASRAPVLSPDGRWIAFARAGDVTLASLLDPSFDPVALGPARPFPSEIPYQFDASGAWIAIALENGVLVLPTAGDGGGRFVPLPEGHRPERLLWSERGGLLAATAREPDGSPVGVLLDPGEGRILATLRGAEILGVPDDKTVWLVGPRAGLPWAEAFVWNPGGQVTSSFVCPDDHLILAWVPKRNAVLLVALAEDMGDPADVAIASLSGGEPRPLIQGVSGARDITVSSDGAYVTFLNEEDSMAVYLVSTGQGDSAARRIPIAEPAAGRAEGADADLDLLVEVACLATPPEGVPCP